MELLDFINNNNDWREKLAASPYNLTIENDPPYVVINATANSNYNFKLVREANEARFRFENDRAICVAAAIDHALAPTLDWESVETYQLIEGKQVVAWNDQGVWHNAIGDLSPEYAYTFIVTGEEVESIADYGKEKCYWFIGMRNMRTGKEEHRIPNFNSNVRLPFHFKRLKSKKILTALEQAVTLNEVGYVCVDKNGDRMAFYGDAWKIAKKKTELSPRDIVELWQKDELEIENNNINVMIKFLEILIAHAEPRFQQLKEKCDNEEQLMRKLPHYLPATANYILARWNGENDGDAVSFFKTQPLDNIMQDISYEISTRRIKEK